MKNLFKNKRVVIAISSALAVLLIIGTLVFLQRPNNETEPESSETTVSDTAKDVIVEKPDGSETSETDGESAKEEISDDGTGIKPDESVDTTAKKANEQKAENTVKPDAPVTPAEHENSGSSSGGIVIGEGDKNKTYSCGAANHHCEAPETHAYIQNLELEGCPYCKGHSCPSFYTTDEWGNACPDATKCPSYSNENNILKKCQYCGRVPKDGTNGTCVQFLLSCDCPNCGVHVEANTCHTCG